jgi:hypothetical protein
MRTPLGVVVFLLFASGGALGQARTGPSPTPGPEVRALGYYVGTWRGHGETKGGPFGPVGKLSSEMTCNWFAGGFQIVCRGEERGPTGKRGFLNILAFDQKTKSYTEYSISSLGESEYDRGGSLVGGKLVFLLDQDGGGKPVKLRYTEVHISPGLYTYRAEAARGMGPWITIAEGKITKAK